MQQLLLAAQLAEVRGDTWAKRGYLENAQKRAPDDPIPALELARFFLSSRTGSAPEADFAKSVENLRAASSIPMSALIGQALARRQRRAEDAERILAELMEDYPQDPRVLQLWTGEAIRRGWDREAEETLQRIQEISPGARFVFELRLQVLETLERWEERRSLMLEKAEREPADLWLIENLATDCSVEKAAELLQSMSDRYRNPAIEVAVFRLLVELGEFEQAREQLEFSSQRWGMFPTLTRFAMVLAARDPAQLAASLEQALSRTPHDLELRTLAWRLGAEPFYEKFRVDSAEMLEADQPESSADSVLLLDQAVERVFVDGSSLYYYHGLTRTLTPEGVRQAAVLEWMPGAVPLRLRVHRLDGSVIVPNARSRRQWCGPAFRSSARGCGRGGVRRVGRFNAGVRTGSHVALCLSICRLTAGLRTI